MSRDLPAPRVIEPLPLQLRMLRALAYCTEMSALGADPAWCVEAAARHELVEQIELARRWLTQLVAAERARAALAGLREADAGAVKSLGPRQRRPRREADAT